MYGRIVLAFLSENKNEGVDKEENYKKETPFFS